MKQAHALLGLFTKISPSLMFDHTAIMELLHLLRRKVEPGCKCKNRTEVLPLSVFAIHGGVVRVRMRLKTMQKTMHVLVVQKGL